MYFFRPFLPYNCHYRWNETFVLFSASFVSVRSWGVPNSELATQTTLQLWVTCISEFQEPRLCETLRDRKRKPSISDRCFMLCHFVVKLSLEFFVYVCLMAIVVHIISCCVVVYYDVTTFLCVCLSLAFCYTTCLHVISQLVADVVCTSY